MKCYVIKKKDKYLSDICSDTFTKNIYKAVLFNKKEGLNGVRKPDGEELVQVELIIKEKK